ncbi:MULTISPECIES: hypothetical protein [Bartonella]|nr:hypothetical protein [Bartonella choladocola]
MAQVPNGTGYLPDCLQDIADHWLVCIISLPRAVEAVSRLKNRAA